MVQWCDGKMVEKPSNYRTIEPSHKMAQKIEQDLKRFKDIVRGRIKKELRKFITSSELIGKKGKDLVSIPIPQIDIPRFVYGDKPREIGRAHV